MTTSTGPPPPRYEPTRGLALWGTDEVQAALEVVRSRSLFRYYGPDLQHRADRFERDLASTIGTRHAIAVSSGTAALACALVGLGIPIGAEVIIPALTFVGCVNAISWARGVPVIAAVDDTLTLDPTVLDSLVTDRTFAIMPVHLGNVAADMDPILAVARRHGLRVLEDCAQAVGVSYRGRRVGAIGDVGAFSFQLEKNMTAGEGGALTTEDDRIYDRAVRYQDQGGQFTTSRGETRGADLPEPFVGVNLRITELSAAILQVQLGRLDPMLERLRTVAGDVRLALAGTVPAWRRIPDEVGSGGDVTMLLGSRIQARRVLSALTAAGVPARTPYQGQGVYANSAVRDGRTAWGIEWERPARCHATERIAGGAVTIDLGAAMTDDDVSWLIDTVRATLTTIGVEATSAAVS